MIDALVKIELEQLVAAEDWEALARHPRLYLKPEVALALSHDQDTEIRSALAENRALAHLPDVALAIALASSDIEEDFRKATSLLDLADYVVFDLDTSVRLQLASNLALADLRDVALHLMDDPDTSVRLQLASNLALVKLPEVATKLGEDADPDIRRALAQNPALSLPTLLPPLKPPSPDHEISRP